MPFRCNFLDGPWAGQSVVYEIDLPKIEVSRPGKRGGVDEMFCYGPAATRTTDMKETDYKITYDGPAYK